MLIRHRNGQNEVGRLGKEKKNIEANDYGGDRLCHGLEGLVTGAFEVTIALMDLNARMTQALESNIHQEPNTNGKLGCSMPRL